MDLKSFEHITSSWWPVIISFLISVIGAIRLYAGGTKCPNENRLDGQLMIVTGGSSGMGLAIVKQLAKRGARILIACRDMEKGSKAIEDVQLTVRNAQVAVKHLDVSSMQSIRVFADSVLKEEEKVDVLINNAGIIFHQHEITDEYLEKTFATNYLGPFLLSHLLLPLLDKSQNGRIINISSAAHKMASLTVDNLNFAREFLYRSAFGQTKLALVLFTKHFGLLLNKAKGKAGSRVTVNAVNPGLVRGTNHLKMSPLGNSWMTRISTLPWTWLFLKSVTQGAQSVIYVATDAKFAKCTGEYISECEIDEANLLVKDKELLEEVYQRSCELCNIKPFKQ